NFQILTAQNDLVNLKSLCDYTIEHFFPTIEKGNYLAFLNEVVVDTIHLIVEWERVGFVHGVMNTDNMSILGLTIDYGPYGWVDNFDPKWTPNTTDKHEKRYRFENQINVAYWNLYQLANAIFPLINDASAVEKILDQIPDMYNELHLTMKSKKLGLTMDLVGTKELIAELDQLLYHSEMDMTLFYRHLSSFESSGIQAFLDTLRNCSYAPHFDNYLPRWQNWLDLYAKILDKNPSPNRKESMNLAKPKYILRNYMAQLAIDKAYEGDYTLVAELYRLIRSPYYEQYEQEKWFVKRPEWAKTKVGSSMLSCSS
ncbi:MAG TPA: protein adenylyltransferase SelO family protein, partial [Saprospiraceae bacterium]|nr:protein adenylyltransferase SelO family protein [Saprospiraceae bacterium]